MATLTTSQKALVVVRNPTSGAVLPQSSVPLPTVEPGDIAHCALIPGQGNYVYGDKPGDCVLHVSLPDGQSGALAITVAFDPLIVELGTPEAK